MNEQTQKSKGRVWKNYRAARDSLKTLSTRRAEKIKFRSGARLSLYIGDKSAGIVCRIDGGWNAFDTYLRLVNRRPVPTLRQAGDALARRAGR